MIREPMLLDQVLACDRRTQMVSERNFQKRIDDIRLAKRFVLDEGAAIYLARMLREHPRIVADAGDFAILPFERMWIELPARPFFKEISGVTPDALSDKHIGYLFHGPLVHMFASTDRDMPLMSPVEYLLHRPMTFEQQQTLAGVLGTSRMGLDFWFWGESATTFTGGKREVDGRVDEWDKEGMRALRDSHTAQITELAPEYQHRLHSAQHGKVLSRIVDGSAGDLRNVIALLLFLNRTADIQYTHEVGPARAMLRRKPAPLLSHRVITIKLDPMPRFRKLVAGAGIKRRLHDVRGHFCHDKTAREGCPHGAEYAGDFGEWWTEYDVLKWSCPMCGGKRWWRVEHRRGDAKRGVVAHDYAVKR